MRIFFISFFFFATTAFAQKAITGNQYLNQPLPANNPVLFAPNIISDEFGNRDMAISPKGDELFYTLQYRGGFVFSTIMYSKKVNGKWTVPEVAPFCGQYNDLEPAFSDDGNTLYFSSSRPVSGTEQKDYDIWTIKKETGVWANPQNMESPVNTALDEYYASVAKNGDIYFTRAVDGREEDIMKCAFEKGKYSDAIALSDSVNSTGDEFNAFVDPGEQYIIFTGYKRKGNIGSGDLFISYKNKNGEWGEAKNMGNKINGPGLTYCPYITPDKKYFFFTTSRGIFKTPFEKKENFKELKSYMQSPLNGWDNIYWVEAKEIINKQE